MTEDIDPRELIISLRGVPDHCDFCGRTLPSEQLEPEEGGDWVCWDCLKRWEQNEEREQNDK